MSPLTFADPAAAPYAATRTPIAAPRPTTDHPPRPSIEAMSPSLLARLARLTVRRRGAVVAAWLALLAATIALAPGLAGDYAADYGVDGSESERAAAVLAERFPGRSGDTVSVVWRAPDAAKGAARERADRFLADAARLPGVGDPSDVRVARDGQTALAQLQLDRRSWDVPDDTGKRLIALAEDAGGGGLEIALGGGPIMEAQDGGEPEGVGLIAAAVILLIAFGSVVAAGLPLAVALFGLGISAPLIGVLAAVADVPEWAPAPAALIGIGVGIDYALLILTRFRTALAAGADVPDAVVEAVTTAGRSTLIAGTTVLISLLGLFFVGIGYLNGVALAAGLSVLVVMAASVTLLPALLALAGRRVDRLRLPLLGRAAAAARPSVAARWSAAVQQRPWAAVLAGGAVLLLLAAPALGLRLGFPDAGNGTAGTMTRTAYDMVAEGFGPGANGPLLLAVEGESPGNLAAIAERAAREPGVAYVSDPQRSPDGGAAVITVVPAGSPQDEATAELVGRLRADLPATVHVGGTTAAFVDQGDLVGSRLPVFIAGVVGLSFLLLLAAFRSPLIALKAGVMNLLSVGAAYGVVTLAASGGWLGQLMGIDTDTPVAPFIPVMMFAILFGLSMDYEVFLLSRVREEYLRHGDTGRAVTDGLAKTARVITAAAAIMVAVFLAFVVSGEVFLRLLGLGMATAIFVDATVVRMVLVPGLMQLLGRANWWIPRWLDRALPKLA
jgi:RND superfamily putative drug exporter